MKEQQAGRKDGVERACLWDEELQGMPREWRVGASSRALSPLLYRLPRLLGARLAKGEATKPIRALHGSWEVGRLALIMSIFLSKKLSPWEVNYLLMASY